ncbi:hypothetical protein [Trichlorobacter lovleyi]|uniref:Uncharacterized protein n=1 Tax=Trichlorobacter lovleyi (strain ATCC BAA-1151 / DSM 17278 / SZ) TaxID=398767 RepID=B3E512_TRIL1|nr:hypothetical protein [Trichlorobacter lovleyi]ACD94577.1 hypothetical protein Glov_0853 [Trichlorobacter lovleyi SZ]
MRLLAHLYPDYSSPIITVHEALRLQRQYPDKWGKRCFYDLTLLRELHPIDRGAASTFAYPEGCLVEYGKHSKGIAHELVLNYICNTETWPVELNGKKYLLQNRVAIDEFFITDIATRNTCLVDCHMFLTPKSELYNELAGRLGIEVTPPFWWMKFFKKRTLKKFNLTVFELKMLPEWHVADPVNFTVEEIKQLQGKITDYLNSGTKLTCLFNPG